MNNLRDILFSPFESPHLSLKNRIVMNPVPTGFVDKGEPTEENIKFYGLRAKSVGLIIAGAINIEHPTATNNEKVPNIIPKNYPFLWNKVTQAVHDEKSKIVAELWHSGSSRAFSSPQLATNVSTPSGVVGKERVGEPLSNEEIEEIIQSFANAAKAAKDFGFDGIDIHGAHGSLIHDFLASDTNKRTDKYGINNRTKFVEEVIKECRKRVGEDFPIIIRLSNFKNYNPQAKLVADSVELKNIVTAISNAGVDIFDCSEINYFNDAIAGEKGNLSYWIKRFTNKPVIATGGLGSSGILYKDIPKLIKEVVSNPSMSYPYLQKDEVKVFHPARLISDFNNGKFDLVAFGRPLLINANWIEELKENL